MWLRHPLVVFEQSGGEFGNAAHRNPSEIKGLDALAFVHVGDVLLGHKRRLGVVKVQIGESLTSKKLCGKTFKKVLMRLLLGNGPFGENLHITNQLPIRRCWTEQLKIHFRSCRLARFCHW
jgi:hypothetical protein